jgi:hypothetical protein
VTGVLAFDVRGLLRAPFIAQYVLGDTDVPTPSRRVASPAGGDGEAGGGCGQQLRRCLALRSLAGVRVVPAPARGVVVKTERARLGEVGRSTWHDAKVPAATYLATGR